MRRLILFIVLFIGPLITANAQFIATETSVANAIDSLSKALTTTTDPMERVAIYRNLADVAFESTHEVVYLRGLYEQAKKSSNNEQMINALGDLAFTHIKLNQLDSARHHMALLKSLVPEQESRDWLTYLKMRLFDYEIYLDSEKLASDLEPTTSNRDDVYTRIERAYIIGSGLREQGKDAQAIPYLMEAVELSKRLPPKLAHKFQSMCIWQLAKSYVIVREGDKMIALIEHLIQLQRQYYDIYYKHLRPFYNINVRYIQNYGLLLSDMYALPKEKAKYYMQQLMDLTEHSTNLLDIYSKFQSLNNYYLSLREYSKAQNTNDSLIKLAYLVAPYNVPGLYQVSSRTYEAMGNYKMALESLQLALSSKDSLISQQTQRQISELQVQYDVDKLNYEKSQLEVKNKRILLIFMHIVLLISILWGVYLYRNLKRERYLKDELSLLNIKAEESERMKTAFINSMCHEIRTPLNAIVGFTDLIHDESIDVPTKKSFVELIRKNIFLLTSQMDNMFEVANLDSSDDMLSCEQVSLNAICSKEMCRLMDFGSPAIEYRSELPEEDLVIYTHAKYLGIVVGHLLDNANKFTEHGVISLSYEVDVASSRLSLWVTDTGCGIPVEKHDVVFNRFSKLDSFTQGNGLGLYLCQLIMTRLGGEIKIDTTYTNGARFVIELPM